MECGHTRVCEVLVGLGDVEVLGVEGDEGGPGGGPLRVHVRQRCPDRGAGPAAGRCGLMESGLWSWWTCRRSGGRAGWFGTSVGGAARCRAVRREP